MPHQNRKSRNGTGLLNLMSAVLLGLFAPFVNAQFVSTPLTESSLSSLSGTWDYRVGSDGGLWVSYYDEKQQLRLRSPDATQGVMAREGVTENQTGLAMASLESGMALLWREKFPTKELFLKRTDKPEATAIGLAGDSEVLTRFEAIRHQNELSVLWYGEKQLEDSDTPYHLYYRAINLSDNLVSPLERVMPGYYPMLALDPQGNAMVASWMSKEKPARMATRFRGVETKAFGPSVTIAEVPNMSPVYKIFENKGRWFVMWLGMYDKNVGEFILEGAYSDDAGTTWQRFAMEELRGVDLGSLDIVTNDEGHILVAVSGRYRKTPDTDKHKIYILRSEDNGSTWSLAPTPRPGIEIEGINALNPMVAFGAGKGQVLVVWEDWREIRGRLYASLSQDYGKTWTLTNLPLPHAPAKNLTLRASGHDLWMDRSGRFRLIAGQAQDDGLKKFDLLELSFAPEDLVNLSKEVTPVPSTGESTGQDQNPAESNKPTLEEALRQRANIFWQAMVANDYPTAYVIYDPFFRANVNIDGFMKNMGRVKYHKFEVGEINIKGNIAKVEIKASVSIPKFRVPSTGELIERPEREMSIKDTWLWVDDGWYREFSSEQMNGGWTQY
jgi:hypothetical protein